MPATFFTDLARQVAPDEAELADLWLEAYLQGGASRRELFAQAGPTAGGFTSGAAVAILPRVLQALAIAAPLAMSALSSPQVGDFLSCIKTGLTVAELRAKRDELAERRRKPEPRAAAAPRPAVPGSAEYAPLGRMADALGASLRAQGLNDDQADLVTFRTLKALLEAPAEGAALAQQAAAPTP